MFLIYFYAMAAASAVVAAQAQQREKENVRRRSVGLPPLPSPQPVLISEKEQREIARESRRDEIVFWLLMIFSGAVFTAPFAAFFYVVIKLAFAKQGIDWP